MWTRTRAGAARARGAILGAFVATMAGGCAATYEQISDHPPRYLIQCGDDPDACRATADEICEGSYFVVEEDSDDRYVPSVSVTTSLPSGATSVSRGVGRVEEHTMKVGCGARYGLRP